MRKLSVALALVTLFTAGTLSLQAQTHAIRGTIQEFGSTIGTRPLQGATVTLSPGGRSAITDANGFYSIGSVLAGDYTLRVTAPGHATIDTRITVSGDMVLNYVMQVAAEERHELRGRITETGSFGKRGLAGATVTVQPGNHSQQSDRDGYFRFVDLPEGSYTLTATAAGHTSARRAISLTRDVETTLNLPVTGTRPDDDDDDDDDDDRDGFSGVIRTSDGRAISGATIRLTPGNYVTTTDSQGRFRLANVPNGTYMMHIRASGYPAMNRKITIGSDRSETITIGGRDDDDDRGTVKEKKQKKEKKEKAKGKKGKGKGKGRK